MQLRTTKAYTTLLFLLSCVCTLFLLGYAILPQLSTYDPYVILQQANLQITREQYLTKEVIILEDRPDSQAVAINALQTNLPQFEKIQHGLLTGDATDGLPGNPTDLVKQNLLLAQNDYLALDTAYTRIASNHTGHVDHIEVTIVLQHDQNYAVAMYNVAIAEQQDAEALRMQFFIIRITIIIALLLTITVKYTLFTRTLLEKVEQQEQKEHDRGGLYNDQHAV